jgi:hypothetical protein
MLTSKYGFKFVSRRTCTIISSNQMHDIIPFQNNMTTPTLVPGLQLAIMIFCECGEWSDPETKFVSITSTKPFIVTIMYYVLNIPPCTRKDRARLIYGKLS